MQPKTNASFFPGLNGLRAIAAYSVLIQHCLQALDLHGNTYRSFLHSIFLPGKDSVTLFFVLSGFLITYQLIQEQDQKGRIELLYFYKRRILRIFPLYFLIVSVSIVLYLFFPFLIPAPFQLTHPLFIFSLFFLFLPNLAILLDNRVYGSSHLWSLGVENQFYIMWPILIMKFKKNLIRMIQITLITKWVLTWIIIPFILHRFSNHYLMVMNSYLKLFSLESLVIGALGAWCVYNHKKHILQALFSPINQIISYGAIILVLYNYLPSLPNKIRSIILPFLFLTIILNVSCNPKSFIKLNNAVMNYLGKISYGVYMFHTLVIFIVVRGYKHYFSIPLNNKMDVYGIYLAVVILTTIVASLSYYYFEQWFLRIKLTIKNNNETLLTDKTVTA